MMRPHHSMLLRALHLERKKCLLLAKQRAYRMKAARTDKGLEELTAARDALRNVDMADDTAIQCACRRVHMAIQATRAAWGERRVAP
jgi:hypothetical protein